MHERSLNEQTQVESRIEEKDDSSYICSELHKDDHRIQTIGDHLDKTSKRSHVLYISIHVPWNNSFQHKDVSFQKMMLFFDDAKCISFLFAQIILFIVQNSKKRKTLHRGNGSLTCHF